MKKKKLPNLKLSLGKKRISNLHDLRGGATKTANGGNETCYMSCVNFTKAKYCRVDKEPIDQEPANN